MFDGLGVFVGRCFVRSGPLGVLVAGLLVRVLGCGGLACAGWRRVVCFVGFGAL